MRTWALLGHSNGFGLAGFIDQLLAAPHLQPMSITDPERIIWKNIYVFTSALGYAGEQGTPPTHGISEGAWLELTTNNPASPAAPHPHPSPYAYPNNTGIPLPNYAYNADFDPNIDRGSGTMAGIEIGLSWELSNYWQESIGFVKMAAPGSLFLRYDQGIGAAAIFTNPVPTPEYALDLDEGYFDWYTPTDTFDWAPGTDRLYARFVAKMNAAKAADSTMDVDLFVLWFGDNDSNRSRERCEHFEHHAREFVKRIRADAVENGWTSLPAHQVKIIWPGVLDYYDGRALAVPEAQGNPDFLNEILQRMEDDDPYFRTLDVSGYSTWDDDPGHFDGIAYAQIHKDIFDLYLEMETQAYPALDRDELLTVDEFRRRIRLYYTRGKVNTDIGDELLLLHLNGAMHHMLHQCGDYAWWLRHRMDLRFTGGGVNNPVTLPKMVHRVLRIETIGDATRPMHFEMLGHTTGSRLQIVLRDAAAGTYTCHFIRMPKDLTRDSERVPVPQMLVEWLVVEVCVRLAKAAANPLQVAAFMAEANKLREDVLKNLATTQRAKRDRLYTQRRLPDVLHRRRGHIRWEA